MKQKAQIICAVAFLTILVKSFFMNVNVVDAIMLIAVSLVYCMYEVLTENRLEKELREHKENSDKVIQQLQKDINDTKNYVSKFSAGQALIKR